MSSYKFSLDTFKKWMKDHNEEDQHVLDRTPKSQELIDCFVESKIGWKKLIHKMTTEADENTIPNLAKEFEDNGGKIVEINGNDFIIEVDGGQFAIHRCYVKKPYSSEA